LALRKDSFVNAIVKKIQKNLAFWGRVVCFFPNSRLSLVPDVCHFSLSHFLFLIFVFFPSYIPSPSVHTLTLYIIVVVVVCVDVNMSENNDGQCFRLSDCTRGGNKMFELVRSSITHTSLVFSLTKHLFLLLFILSVYLFCSFPYKSAVLWYGTAFIFLMVYKAINV